MRVKALRGVCIGVERHLVAGDTADLEPGLVTYLVGIGAVAPVKDEPQKPEPPAEAPVAQEPPPPIDPPAGKTADPATDSTPAKPGKKDK